LQVPTHVAGLCHGRKAPRHSIAADAGQCCQAGRPAPGTCSAPHRTALSLQTGQQGNGESHRCQRELTWTVKLLLGWDGTAVPMVPPVPALGKDIAFAQGSPVQPPWKRTTSWCFPKYANPEGNLPLLHTELLQKLENWL